jgi:hypothetical protein
VNQAEFLTQVCLRAKTEAVRRYEVGSPRLEGTLAGLALCEGRSAQELLAMFEEEERWVVAKPGEKRSDQERRRYRLLQIEWCLDCLAGLESLRGSKSFEWLSWHPTSSAVANAQAILGG